MSKILLASILFVSSINVMASTDVAQTRRNWDGSETTTFSDGTTATTRENWDKSATTTYSNGESTTTRRNWDGSTTTTEDNGYYR